MKEQTLGTHHNHTSYIYENSLSKTTSLRWFIKSYMCLQHTACDTSVMTPELRCGLGMFKILTWIDIVGCNPAACKCHEQKWLKTSRAVLAKHHRWQVAAGKIPADNVEQLRPFPLWLRQKNNLWSIMSSVSTRTGKRKVPHLPRWGSSHMPVAVTKITNVSASDSCEFTQNEVTATESRMSRTRS